jgi:hypothetical protein
VPLAIAHEIRAAARAAPTELASIANRLKLRAAARVAPTVFTISHERSIIHPSKKKAIFSSDFEEFLHKTTIIDHKTYIK